MPTRATHDSCTVIKVFIHIELVEYDWDFCLAQQFA